MREFKSGQCLKHFKRETVEDKTSTKYLYMYIGVATHTEDKTELVIYKSFNDDKIYARPKEMFYSEVDREKYPDIKQQYRFEPIDDLYSEIMGGI